MKSTIRFFLVGIMILVLQATIWASCSSTDVYDGWRLGIQCWTLKNMTLFEAIDQTQALGLRWIEAFPGQQISPEHTERFGPDISKALREKVKQKLDNSGICIKTFGVYGLPNDEQEARKAFEFAKEMGIETIVSEPPFDAFELLDKLCREYKIKVAIHNHPKPTRYWDPEIAVEICRKTSNCD